MAATGKETEDDGENKMLVPEDNVTVKSKYSVDSLPILLRVYYRRLFPFHLFHKWLSYGDEKTFFRNREFSYMLEGDIYVRFQSFLNMDEMRDEIIKRCPHKIDLGAMYNDRPSMHHQTIAFQTREKELVFDVDMTDYDDVRTCCSGADICEKCWPLMTIALKIIDAALREDFGWQHLLWVYSGRRGIHCWVCDESARKLSSKARTAVVEYLSVVKGGENMLRKVYLPTGQALHPSISRALEVIESHFSPLMLDDQDILATSPQVEKVLKIISDNKLRSTLLEELNRVKPSSRARMEYLEGAANSGPPKQQRFVDEIRLQHTYPRLDVNVSNEMNHLLKSPFCIHPKTGRVCVPIDHENVDKFNPLDVPTISDLCDQINEYDKANKGEKDSANTNKSFAEYKKTSLHQSVKIFERFISRLQVSWKGKLMESSDRQGDF